MLVEYNVEQIDGQGAIRNELLDVEEVEEVKLHDSYMHNNKEYIVVEMEVIHSLHIIATCHQVKQTV